MDILIELCGVWFDNVSIFKSRTELENHMKVQHNVAAKHKCSICDEILPSPAGIGEIFQTIKPELNINSPSNFCLRLRTQSSRSTSCSIAKWFRENVFTVRSQLTMSMISSITSSSITWRIKLWWSFHCTASAVIRSCHRNSKWISMQSELTFHIVGFFCGRLKIQLCLSRCSTDSILIQLLFLRAAKIVLAHSVWRHWITRMRKRSARHAWPNTTFHLSAALKRKNSKHATSARLQWNWKCFEIISSSMKWKMASSPVWFAPQSSHR